MKEKSPYIPPFSKGEIKRKNMSVLISLATKKSVHAEVVKWLLLQNAEYTIDIVNSPMPLEHVRNLQVKRFLSSDAEFLFLVDSDCVPKPNTLKQLLDFDLPFISAPHPTIKGNETGVMIMDKVDEGYRQHRPFDKGLEECDAVGCAGMMIRRDVFEQVEKPYFKFIYDKEGQLVKGEDFYFCDKLKEAGIKIYAYCDIVQTHYVEVPI